MMKNAVFCAIVLLAASASTVQRVEWIPVAQDQRVIDLSSAVGSPDVYYTLGSTAAPDHSMIMTMTRSGSTWSAALPVAFSGQWRDLEEVISPDGRTMIFASNRPVDGGTTPIDGFFSGKTQPHRGGNLWRVARNGTEWTQPERLPDVINANTSVFSPALAADGTLYFMRMSEPGPHFHLYIARLENGEYRSVVPAPFGDTRFSDFDPTIAPDNSFVIFGSNRPPAKPGNSDLFISYNRNGAWSAPEDMGASVNPNGDATEPRLSADTKTLYFTSQHALWSADISSWVER